ncbi:hypothetical protein [Sphingobacterium faecale]|uniref:Uncharacterized protein n=1 Tax=Sphingobacterium faecale TaxID=2803775 RepID=A0ABS1RBL7_9SPHI|nr:hypothetical protein [Sphingobacterium faecale]MBL1411236.1 hypothetical protein [Sphingobacterium faecale]
MTTISTNSSWLAQGWRGELTLGEKLFFGFLFLLIGWVGVSVILQLIDPAIGILDFGTLTLAIFGLLLGWLAIYISIWLQEMLWHPFKSFRKQFGQHFNQLTSWQQCIIYFGVFFLLLYAVIMVMVVVF